MHSNLFYEFYQIGISTLSRILKKCIGKTSRVISLKIH